MATGKPNGRPIGKRHQDDVRAKIQASQLVNVLQNHALNEDGKELPASRLKAIEILLRKSVPDLSAVTIGGDPDSPVQHQHSLTVELDFNAVRAARGNV